VKGIDKPRVLEIGAGLGKTAYYALEFGIKDYTIVDIPITASFQAYFLGRSIGEDKICLETESLKNSPEKIKIFKPDTFLQSKERYDLIINVDGMTELDKSMAQSYWDKIKTSASQFISINHEIDLFRMRDIILADMDSLDYDRSFYCVRSGYVEEWLC
jgi:putative sugar O-methyltransferase